MGKLSDVLHDATRARGLGFTASMVAAIVVFLLATNLILGFALVSQSATTTKSLVNEKMLDVSNSAAGMLDGDELETLTADGKDTEAYQRTLRTLRVFYDNIDLKYIYGVKQVGEDTFVFTIDPEPVSPGEFGDPVVTTDALRTAASGTPAVDGEPYEDKWGRFYSAYSPVFNSRGEVAGVVAVDFSAEWYENQVFNHVQTAVVVGILSLGIGALAVVVITSRLRRRFRFLYGELSDLAVDLQSLTKELASPSHPRTEEVPEEDDRSRQPSGDNIDELSAKIHEVRDELHWHIQSVREQAYTDAMTGVNNKAVYMEEINHLGAVVQDGEMGFSIAIFDINGLKQTNDTFGHEMGDRVIVETANAICSAFDKRHVYRIGGDEFIVVMEGSTFEDMMARFAAFDEELKRVNSQADHQENPLSISKGAATFDPKTDTDYHAVVRRADEAMYDEKAAYYRTHGNRLRHYCL